MTEDWLKTMAEGEQPTESLTSILADIALSQRAIAAAEQERVAILREAMSTLEDFETRLLTLEANDHARNA